MENFLPYHGFRWVRHTENFNTFANTEKNIGDILEVDIIIPTHLHDYFNDLPPLFTHEDLGTGLKLMGTLYPKERYVIHEEILK